MTYLETAIKVLKKIESFGFKAYIIGGFVRDYLLKIESNDIDITTSASIADLKSIFGTIILKGEKYDGVIVDLDGYSFEITRFRKDISYNDHRHPQIISAKTLEEDLIRRDFTINAMCFDSNMNLIDLYNGSLDLKNKIIRTIGNACTRFNEDVLRILRAFYFSAKLNFDISEDTLCGINQNAKYLEYLSSERIKEELTKLLNQKYFLKGLSYFLNTKAIEYIPELKDSLCLIYKSNTFFSFNEVLILSKYLGNDISKYNLKKEEKKYIENTLKLIDTKIDNFVLFNSSIEELITSNKIKKILNKDYVNDIELSKNNLIIHNIKELNINASDIIEYVEKNKITETLNFLTKLVLDKKVENKKEVLIEEVKRRKNV